MLCAGQRARIAHPEAAVAEHRLRQQNVHRGGRRRHVTKDVSGPDVNEGLALEVAARMVQGEGGGGRACRGDEVEQAGQGRLSAAAEHAISRAQLAHRRPAIRRRMVGGTTLFQQADVEIALVADRHGVSAGHGHRRSGARALQSAVGRLVRALEPGPAKRQCSRLEVVFAVG